MARNGFFPDGYLPELNVNGGLKSPEAVNDFCALLL
jgi:hypothetical protein